MRQCRWGLVLILAGCGPPRDDTVVIDGSSTAFPLVNVLGEEFRARNPRIEVVANKCGTGGGFQRLSREEIDMAAASRRADPGEAPNAAEFPLGLDGVTVVVHPLNPVRRLSLDALRRVWRGEVDDWADLGGQSGKIAFYGPAEGHGTRAFFAQRLKIRLRRDVQEDPDYNGVVRAVASDPQAIGYVGFDYFMENRERVRALAPDGIVPSVESIASRRYPFTRSLYLYVNRHALDRPAVRDFVRFVRSPAGKTAAQEVRVVPE